MERRTILARAALPAWCGCAVLTVAAIALHAANLGSSAALQAPLGRNLPFILWGIAYTTVGAVIGSRRPENPVGWLLFGAGAVFAVSAALFEYANLALAPSSSLPGGIAAAWVAGNSFVSLALVGLALLLFPAGALPSPRWRKALWLPVGVMVALPVGNGLAPGAVDGVSGPANPLGIGGAGGLLVAVLVVGWGLVVLTFATAGAALIVRLRRSSGAVRLQLKWVAGAGALLGAVWGSGTLTYVLPVPWIVFTVSLAIAFCGIPVAIGIAIMRYRLYGIDVIIRRTLTYGALLALLGAVYLGGVVGLEAALRSVIGQSGSIAVTISTLAVAALSRPALHRIRRAVDRRFARGAYDATRTLASFSGRLRNQIDLETLEVDLVGVVGETLHPAHATLWLRDRAGGDTLARG